MIVAITDRVSLLITFTYNYQRALYGNAHDEHEEEK